MDVRMIVATWPADAPRGAVARFCRDHDVSTSWFHELRARARAQGPVEAAISRSRAPRRSPQTTPVELEELAVRTRKRLADQGWDCGPVSVRNNMIRHGIAPPSRATLARLFTRRGLAGPAPKKRPRASYRRFEFALVNECWQLDASEWRLADGQIATIYQVLDDHSRAIVASLAGQGETAAQSWAVIAAAVAVHGPPQQLLTDNGLAMNPIRRGTTNLVKRRAEQLGIHVVPSSYYHPQTLGKNERVHATLKKWLRARPLAVTLDELTAQLVEFDRDYNHGRPHQALSRNGALRTPAAAFIDDDRVTPPEPAAPAPPPTPVPAPPALHHPKVAANGNCGVASKIIQVGRRHVGERIIALVDGATISLFDPTGTLIRTVHTHPRQRFYGSGVPRGGDHKSGNTQRHTHTKPSGMS